MQYIGFPKQTRHKSSHDLYVMFGKFLSNVHEVKDCQVEIIYSTNSKHEVSIGTFDISNVIGFSNTYKTVSTEHGDLIRLYIYLKRDGSTVGLAEIDIEINDNNVYYSKIVNLGGKRFQIVYYVTGSFETKTLTISVDHPNFKSYELPNFPNINNHLPSLGFKFVDNDRVLAYYGNTVDVFHWNGDSWLRQLYLYTLTDHPNINKMTGFNCERPMEVGFYVEYPENGPLIEFKSKLGFRNYLAGVFTGMAYLNSCGFFKVELDPSSILLDSNNTIKIAGFRNIRSVDVSIAEFGRKNSNLVKKEFDTQHDVYSAVVTCFLLDFLSNKIYGYGFQLIEESIKRREHITLLPYPTEVILLAMLSDEPTLRPTFFELGILLNLGHFHMMNDEGKQIADIYNIDYETGNDYQYYLRSPNKSDLFHCIIFHWFHGKIEMVKEIIEEMERESDDFIVYIRDYLTFYERTNIDIQHKRILYDEFMSLDFNDYRFWLMPPPNLMPQKLVKDGVDNFNSFYDIRNRDHDYDAFFESEKNDIMENLESKFFKLYLMFPEIEIYKSIYYLVVHRDIQQADFYYEILNESKKNEIVDILLKILLAKGADVNVQKFMSLIGKLNTPCHKSSLLHRIVSSEKFNSPSLQFQIGPECIIRLKYENGIYFIDLAAEQNNELAIFYQSLMTFHGHCYQKEQKESLKRLISLGKLLGGEFAFEVSMILLQGVDVEQDIDKGKEMLRYAESGFEIPSLIQRGIYYVKTSSLYYDMLDKELSNQNKTDENPKYQFNIGKADLIKASFLGAEKCLKFALERDYFEAEFVYSLISSAESVCDHLFRGAKGGCVESQVFLGLHLIYGIEDEYRIQEGIRWLRTAACQDNPLAFKIIMEIFTHGFESFFIDIEKAKDYETHFKSLPSVNLARNSQISDEVIKNYIRTNDPSMFNIIKLKTGYIEIC